MSADAIAKQLNVNEASSGSSNFQDVEHQTSEIGAKTLLPSATKLRRLCFYTCLSFCSQGGVCLSACWDTTPPPRGRQAPRTGAGTPRTRHPPRPGTPPGAEMATAADGTHPTGMHSCFARFLPKTA